MNKQRAFLLRDFVRALMGRVLRSRLLSRALHMARHGAPYGDWPRWKSAPRTRWSTAATVAPYRLWRHMQD